MESALEMVIAPVTHDLGDFKVNRTLPAKQRTMVGPFIFVDEFGPARLPAVIRLMALGSITAWLPMLSRCSIAPSNR